MLIHLAVRMGRAGPGGCWPSPLPCSCCDGRRSGGVREDKEMKAAWSDQCSCWQAGSMVWQLSGQE